MSDPKEFESEIACHGVRLVQPNHLAPPLSQQVHHVLVLATMSAGKSTLINALLGTELLHAANEATTACLTSIHLCPDSHEFYGTSYCMDGQMLASASTLNLADLREWNEDSRVRQIRLTGKARSGLSLSRLLVLHDTPGPNNSQDQRHEQAMLDAVRGIPFQTLCYVLNAEHLGTQDDRHLLAQLRHETARKPAHSLLFILNKVDSLDEDRGEDVQKLLGTARTYLKDLGFSDPTIIPTMAKLGLLARKKLNYEALTKSQLLTLATANRFLEDRELPIVRHAIGVPEELRTEVQECNAELLPAPHFHEICSKNFEGKFDMADLYRLLHLSGISLVEAWFQRENELVRRDNLF